MKTITKRKNTDLALPGELTATSWVLPEELSLEAWGICGEKLSSVERSVMWWMGDWWRFGERKYGERIKAIPDDGPAFQTWKDAGWVAGKIERSRRKDLLSFATHREVAALDPAEQDEVLDWAETQEKVTVRAVRAKVRLIQGQHQQPRELPLGQYRVIYADPPWQYGNSGHEKYGNAERHYPTMALDELCALPVKDLAAPEGVLFLWVTSPMLEISFQVIEAWGFEYKTSFVWDKVKHNFGHYNSVRHEFLLVCTRGSYKPEVSSLTDSVIEIERGAHSEKPGAFRELINTLYPTGPKIELFCRGAAPEGWEVWGDQSATEIA